MLVINFQSINKPFSQFKPLVSTPIGRIFKHAFEYNAVSIVLIHNHPSGNTKPSSQDFNITKSIINGAKTLNINIIDHLIIAQNSYYSFADEGELYY